MRKRLFSAGVARDDGARYISHATAAIAEVAGDAAAQFGDIESFSKVHFEHGAAAHAHGQQVLRALSGFSD